MENNIDDMTRDQLIELARDLRAQAQDDADVRATIRQIQKFVEKYRAQNEQLIAAHEVIAAERNRYADLYEFAPVAYATLDSGGIILEINLTGATLLGMERRRLINAPLFPHVDEPSRRLFLDHLQRCRADKGLVATRLKLKSATGEIIDVQLSTRDGARTAITPLDDRHRDEAEIHQSALATQAAAQSLAAKDRFVAALSHELRTPLTPILAALEEIERDPQIPRRLLPALAMFRRNLQLEIRLIEDLLDATRLTHDKLVLNRDILDLHDLIQRGVESCASELRNRKLKISLQLNAAYFHVNADATRLQQVLWNLLKNAMKFTGAGGAITVSTSNPQPALVRLTIADTGIGFDPHASHRIFRAFEQDGPSITNGGLGLGLAIASGIVQAHGGLLQGSSPGLGKGAVFSVDLAIAAPSPAAPAPSVSHPAIDKSPAQRKGLRLLLVEDHRDTARVLARLLTSAGFDVSIADSVQSALPLASACDMLVSDLGLPDGTGYDLMQIVRKTHPVKSIALSGYATEDDVRRSKEAGFHKHLTKPIDFQKLLAAIDEVLQSAAR